MDNSFETLLEHSKQAIRYWWLLLLTGIALFIIGLVVFLYPAQSYLGMSLMFGFLIFFSGLFQIILSAGNKHYMTGRGWMLAGGIIEVILGVILILNTALSAATLPIFLAFWLLFRSFSAIGLGSDMNAMNVEVSNAVRKGKFNSFAALNYSHTDGHRKDMGFGGWGGYLKLGYDFTAHWKAFADVNLNHFAASNPGSVTAPLIDNDALITRGMTSFSLDNRYERTSGSLKFFYNFGYHKIDDGHSPGQPSPDYRFRSRDRMLGITAYQSYRLFTGNQTTLGADYQRSGGRAWNRYPNRDEQLADKTLNDVAVYLNMQQTLARWMTLNAGVRMDYNPHFGAQWVPQFGISFPIAPETVLKAILSKGFRTPTIREMYMFPPQNPDLRPERLMNYEFSVTQSFWQRKLSLSANVYYLKGDNTIQAVFDGNRPINVNTGRIENYGVELTARYRAVRSLAFSGNYSWLHMEYKILAAPQHKLYAGIDFIRPRWSVSTGVQYIRGLYTDLKAPGTEQFVLWNLRASWQASSVVELFARGENLLAQDYEINAGYPMPRATVFGGVNLRF